MEDNIIISDENLLKFFSKENLEDMAFLFSNGSFQELIDKYFCENKSKENKEKEVSHNSNNKEVSKISNLNYEIFDKLAEDKLCQQIILAIVIFCLLKNKEVPEALQTLFEKYNYPLEETIFPLIFLKIKYYTKTNNISSAISLIKKVINNYEAYSTNLEVKKNDIKNIYTIETFHQKFVYFYNIFNYLYSMNNLDSKIKKLYFELKSCLNNLNSFSQAYKTILDLYQRYPDDILIQFELAKDSVINSKLDVFKKILEKMKKKCDEENDENLKGVYHCYILYLEALSSMAYNQFTEAKKKLEEIVQLKKEENNAILKNNIAIVNIYKNNLKDSYDKLANIYYDKNNENKNEIIKDTMNLLEEKFIIN